MPICQVCGKPNADDARFCFSCGASLSRVPPVKVDVKSPITGQTVMPQQPQPIYTPRQIQAIGTCYYHHDIPSAFVCARCGRSICAGCNRQYGTLSFCTECYWALSPKLTAGQPSYPYPPAYYPPPEQSGRPFF
jgi:hypothetical protein